MLNCIDMDGQGQGYDTPLITAVQDACGIPVVASSGAGAVSHFSTVSCFGNNYSVLTSTTE
jgi:glutamine amidotransferase/cyclase